jgi:hypothetical protein
MVTKTRYSLRDGLEPAGKGEVLVQLWMRDGKDTVPTTLPSTKQTFSLFQKVHLKFTAWELH